MSAFDAVLERFAALAEYEGARDRVLLNLMGVSVTVDGPETPAVADVADQLRGMIAEWDPGPVRMFGPTGNRRQRRADASRQRRRT